MGKEACGPFKICYPSTHNVAILWSNPNTSVSLAPIRFEILGEATS